LRTIFGGSAQGSVRPATASCQPSPTEYTRYADHVPGWSARSSGSQSPGPREPCQPRNAVDEALYAAPGFAFQPPCSQRRCASWSGNARSLTSERSRASSLPSPLRSSARFACTPHVDTILAPRVSRGHVERSRAAATAQPSSPSRPFSHGVLGLAAPATVKQGACAQGSVPSSVALRP